MCLQFDLSDMKKRSKSQTIITFRGKEYDLFKDIAILIDSHEK
jgi:hypothetical protein